MSKVLHFLNGDATKSIFDKTDIHGSTAVMREMFVSGHVLPLHSSEFWSTRKKFFKRFYLVSEKEYNIKIISELNKVQNAGEIVIWYEYDLYCQLNTLFLIQWLDAHQKSNISLVCSGTKDGRWIGLGERIPTDYRDLFEKRLKIGTKEREDAKDIWNAYISPIATDLNAILDKCESWPYLSRAMKGHFQRFGDVHSGLSVIEKDILDLLNTGSMNGKTIIKKLLTDDDVYGFGDLQYLHILLDLGDWISPTIDRSAYSSMDELIDKVWNTTFSKNSTQMLNEQPHVVFRNGQDHYLGGAKRNAFNFHDDQVVHREV